MNLYYNSIGDYMGYKNIIEYQIDKGVRLNVIESNKFKHISIMINFYNIISDSDYIIKLLISMIVSESCGLYPSKSLLSIKKDSLFGFVSRINCFFRGSIITNQFYNKILNSKYTGIDIREYFELMSDILYHPIFDIDGLNEAKENLKSAYARMKDDKLSYASSRVDMLIGLDNYLKYHGIIDDDSIDRVSLDDIIRVYNDILDHDNIDIYVYGDVSHLNIYDLFIEYFKFGSRGIVEVKDPFIYKFNNELVINEFFYDHKIYTKDDMCNVIMVYSLDDINKDDLILLQGFNTLLGMFPSSLLFSNIREKYSYCYRIFSSVKIQEGLLYINASTTKEFVDDLIELVDKQLSIISNGEFSVEHLDSTIDLYCDSFFSLVDYSNSLIQHIYISRLFNLDIDIDHKISAFKTIKKEDIISITSRLKNRLIYTNIVNNEKDC